MSSKQIRLLAQPNFLQRRLRRMPRQILSYVKHRLAEEPTLSNDQLIAEIVAWQTLDPLRVGPLQSISLEVDERLFMNSYRVQFPAYRAEAIIPYGGSPELWSARPSKTFDLEMRGIVQRSNVRVVTVHHTKDWPLVEESMLSWLDDVQEALPEFEPTLIVYNVLLRKRITPVVLRSIEIARVRISERAVVRH